MSDYRKLLVWQRSHAVALQVYKATKAFPKDEMFGLTSQLRRAASSVPANIAEGTGRGTQPELARFCRVARGSLNEVEYHLLLSHDLDYLGPATYEPLRKSVRELRRMLTKFIQTL